MEWQERDDMATGGEALNLDVLSVEARLLGLMLIDQVGGLPTLPTWPLHRPAMEAASDASLTLQDGVLVSAAIRWRVRYVRGLGRVCPELLRAVTEAQQRGLLEPVRPGWWTVAPVWRRRLRRSYRTLGRSDAALVARMRGGWAEGAAQVLSP